jgi:hypothetical protein
VCGGAVIGPVAASPGTVPELRCSGFGTVLTSASLIRPYVADRVSIGRLCCFSYYARYAPVESGIGIRWTGLPHLKVARAVLTDRAVCKGAGSGWPPPQTEPSAM